MKRLSSEDLQEEAKYLRLLVFGEPGTGKSWLGASACMEDATSPVLYLDYRGQVASLQANPDYIEAIADGRLVVLRLGKYSELNHVYTWLFKGKGSVPGMDKLFPEEMPRTLVLDSVTELQRMEVMRRAGNKPNVFLTEVEVPQIQDWGSLLNQFILLAKLFYDLPLHTMFTALEIADTKREIIGGPERVTALRPAFQGQTKRLFPAYALTVMRLERAARNAAHYNVGKTRAQLAHVKDQTGRIPATVAAPTIPKLVRLLRGHSPAVASVATAQS